MATRDAQVIIRIEEELEPGGLLSQERCSLFAPENVEEPGRQWAHYDHLVKAAQNIRRLMIAEQTRHRLTAKKLAEACRDEWLRRQPKSDQQLETEARARNIAKYRIVTRSIAGMWENVRGEVNRQRLARWEAEEQKRVKAALNEAVNISEQKLQARRTTMDEGESDAEDIITNSPSAHNLGDDIDMMTDSAESASENEDDVNRSESDATALDDDDMSDSVDESDDGLSSFDNDERKTEVDDDEILTPDQLRAKYADLPKISHKPGTEADAIVIKADDAETSDESVDMDDDLGSSDMSETGSENGSINGNVDDDDDSDSDGESDGATGLLGMLFGKQELRNFKQEETPDDTQSNAASEAPPTTLADANDRVMLNWEMEFKKWCPGFKIMAYYGSIEERRRKRHGWNNDDLWNVCITSYQLVLQDNQVFRRRKWHYLILDEAHNIKNFKSLRWQTLLGFNTQARLLITGTPLQNNLTELWSLLFFLMPSENGVGGFADLQEFHDWFAKPESQILESGKEQLDEEGRAIISKLHKVLRPYLLRRLKADVEKQMPAKYEHVVFCRLSKRQRELYDGFLARSDTRATLAGGNYLSIINCLMQLRKVCNHPDLFVDRPIQTSLRLEKSVPSEFALTSKIVKNLCFTRNPASSVSLSFLNLVPAEHERNSSEHALRISELCAQDELMSVREAQKERALLASTTLNPTTVESSISFLEGSARWGRFEELQHCVYLNALRCQQKPIYGKNLTDFLTLDLDKRPRIQRPRDPQKLMEWFENKSFLLESIVKDVSQRSEELETTIQKFACVTPAVVSRDMPELFLGSRCVAAFKEKDSALSTPVRWSPFIPPERPLDPWHEARIRLSIQFPDKRLLQYDCGKLQALDKLLRKLQSGGHRALIFTQMTRVLDILEQFLNIHGHKYLRLDGATKVEQRQLLTDRFNSDKRILCFILSTRSGGLGINLTGADTVIFYDQDWNPAMDKQCQDRCHRIGQTRDVHIYRLVSEHTIESNILRKASQKQMLDDVVIQDGGFTTDYFNRVKVHDALDEDDPEADLQNGIAAASAAMDRVLGGGASGNSSAVGHQFEQVEDREDVTAARVAEKEIQDDEADFSERAVRDDSQSQSLRPSEPPSESPATPMVADSASGIKVVAETDFNVHGKPMKTIDDFMLDCMGWMLEGVPLEIPKDKKKNKGRKRGKDTRRR
ncbi:Helicase SWR1 [Ceratocystis platani]|uniref:DNA helicase n=1 Tax=Ceratocystis fimbriata f. sp. platani TaxID=88771 RepID=A0A0F8DI74_CERFI|nr:Helicase SWR1 [Ceratocystis platani]